MEEGVAAVNIPVRRGELLHGKYLIGETLGAGGMGVVVAAENVQLGQKVAIKFLSTTLRWDGEALVRFLREARTAAQIRSEHVVRVLDVSSPDSNICYMVLEYLEGEDLSAILRQRGALPIAEAVGYVLQACEAIAEAHGLGIVHRDLKPSNLFLTRRRDGSPLIKVLDFGISKIAIAQSGGPNGESRGPDLTSTRTVLGSPMYMSPEQIRSARNVDARTDVWSLGLILHELLSDQRVYEAESTLEVFARIAADSPTPLRQLRPEVPAAIEELVLACLEKTPARRLPDVAALARRLEPFAPRWASVSASRIVGAGPHPGPQSSGASSATADTLRPRPDDGGAADAEAGTARIPAGDTTSSHGLGELLAPAPAGPVTPVAVAPAPRSRFGVGAVASVGGLAVVLGGWLVLRQPTGGPGPAPKAGGDARPGTYVVSSQARSPDPSTGRAAARPEDRVASAVDAGSAPGESDSDVTPPVAQPAASRAAARPARRNRLLRKPLSASKPSSATDPLDGRR